jgi:hypothetical protein
MISKRISGRKSKKRKRREAKKRDNRMTTKQNRKRGNQYNARKKKRKTINIPQIPFPFPPLRHRHHNFLFPLSLFPILFFLFNFSLGTCQKPTFLGCSENHIKLHVASKSQESKIQHYGGGGGSGGIKVVLLLSRRASEY